MNYRMYLVLIIVGLSCRTMERLEGRYDVSARKYSYTTDSLFAKVKKSLERQGAQIISEDSVSITAVLHKTTWAWEKKNRVVDNGKAYVVIKKYYDIGSNRVYRPLDVITTWTITKAAEQNTYLIKLVDAEAQYRSVHYVSENHAGVSLGNFEKMIAATNN